MVASVVPGLLLAASISASITRIKATLSSKWDQRQSTNITVNPNTALPGWTFVGCFTDANGPAPTLQEHSLIDETNMTPALCMEFCGNFSTPLNFAGTELGNQCFCDFNIQGAPLRVNDTLCNVACAGDSTLTCGGPLLVSIYQNNNEGVGPLPTNKATVGAFEFAGCLKDADGTTVRTLSTPLTADISDGVNAESCTLTCLENGFTKAGLEFGHECWCDNNFNLPLGVIIAPLEECSRACDTDPTELCGAPNRLSVYTIPFPGLATPLIPISPSATGACLATSTSGGSSASASTTSLPITSSSSAHSTSSSASNTITTTVGSPTSGVPPGRPNSTGSVS